MEKYFDKKVIISVVVGVVVVIVVWVGYNRFFGSKSTTTAYRTQAEYDKMSTEEKAKWKKDEASGNYVAA